MNASLIQLPPGTRLGLDSYMAATNERNDENHEIVGALNIIEDIISRLDSLGDPDYVEGMAIRFDVLIKEISCKYYIIRIDDIMHFGIPP